MSVIGCPLYGTGFGVIVTCTRPTALAGGAGVGEGGGAGVGAGAGGGVAAVGGLLRDGTVLGAPGADSTWPQPAAARAMTMTMTIPMEVSSASAEAGKRHTAARDGAAHVHMRASARGVAPRVAPCTSFAVVSAVVLATILLVPAAAGAQTDPNPGRLTVSGGIDFTNAYMFRGLRQDDTGLIMWPFGDLAIDVYDGDGTLENATVNVGIWNSLHTGSAGSDGPSGELWYESDFYTSFTLGFDGGLNVGATYTAYISPNDSFSTVKEISFRAAVDDTSGFTGLSLRPYALLAFELDTAPGLGQADGGEEAGSYLEIGIAPGWTNDYATIAFPLKAGFSLGDYYELAGEDHSFGFFSVAATASVPLGGTTDYGAWNLRGGVEFQSLGDTPEAFDLGDQSKVIGSIGIAFSY